MDVGMWENIGDLESLGIGRWDAVGWIETGLVG